MKRITIDNTKCDFCGACVGVCPQDAIIMEESNIKIDNQKCSLCFWCVEVCPLGVPEEVS